MKRSIVPYRRTMAIRYSDPGIIDDKIVNLQRVIATTPTVHNRQLPGFTVLSKIYGKPIPPTTDRMYSGIDCDEVYPGIFIGDE